MAKFVLIFINITKIIDQCNKTLEFHVQCNQVLIFFSNFIFYLVFVIFNNIHIKLLLTSLYLFKKSLINEYSYYQIL